MGEWLKLWPVRFAVLVFILNMELVTIPIIFKLLFGFSGVILQRASAIFGTIEVCYWYYFVGWLAIEKFKRSQEIKEAIEMGKQEITKVREDIAKARQSDEGKYYEELLRREILDKYDLERYRNKKIFVFLKNLGYFTGIFVMFGLSLLPLAWIPGLVVCRFSGWRLWFAALLVGNAVKNAYFYAYGWDYVFSSFGR